MYYAIRTGEYKGVYKSKELYKEKLKKDPKASTRIFEKEKQKNEALKWADVKEIADAKQQVVNEPKKKKEKVAVTAQPLFNLSKEELKMLVDAGVERALKEKDVSKPKEIHPVEQMLNDLKDKGVYCVDIEMNSGKTHTICLRNHYYKNEYYKNNGIWHSFENNYKVKDSYYDHKLKELLNMDEAILVLKSINYTFKDDFIFFESNPILEAEKYNGRDCYFYFRNRQFILNTNNIASISASGHYKLGDRWLDYNIYKDAIDVLKL